MQLLHGERKKEIIDQLLNAGPDSESSDEASQDEGEEKESERERLKKPRDFDQYTYHIPHVELNSAVLVSQKIRYIADEALADLGFQNVLSAEFWMSLVTLLLAMWIRAYMHSLGSWFLLKLAGTSVTSFATMM